SHVGVHVQSVWESAVDGGGQGQTVHGVAIDERNALKKRATNITVIDYGMGNLHSVAKALAVAGAEGRVSSDRKTIERSDAIVLPGVGAFGAAMANLAKARLDDSIHAWIEAGKPYLGICLGFQLLFDESEEDPGVRGLGAFRGRVVSFRESDFPAGDY